MQASLLFPVEDAWDEIDERRRALVGFRVKSSRHAKIGRALSSLLVYTVLLPEDLCLLPARTCSLTRSAVLRLDVPPPA